MQSAQQDNLANSKIWQWQTIKRHLVWLIPVLIALILTPFTPSLDLFVAKLAYTYRFDTTSHAKFSSGPFLDLVYLYGVIPAQITCASAILVLIFSIWLPSLHRFRTISWVLAFTLIIGSGLVTHIMLKQFWGRPRPRQIEQFGGSQQFRPYYQPMIGKAAEPSRSFPSGHSTTGFYFFCLYFIGKRLKSPFLSWFGITLSLVLGGALSLARILQGGHFFSDVLIAALIMWCSAVFCDYLFYDSKLVKNNQRTPLTT